MITVGKTLRRATALMLAHPNIKRPGYVRWHLRKEGFRCLYDTIVVYDDTGRYGRRHICIEYKAYSKITRTKISGMMIMVSGPDRCTRIEFLSNEKIGRNRLQLSWAFWLRRRAERVANRKPRFPFWTRFFLHHDSNVRS